MKNTMYHDEEYDVSKCAYNTICIMMNLMTHYELRAAFNDGRMSHHVTYVHVNELHSQVQFTVSFRGAGEIKEGVTRRCQVCLVRADKLGDVMQRIQQLVGDAAIQVSLRMPSARCASLS